MRQTLNVQVSLRGPTLLQTPPASYLGAHRLLPVAALLLAVRPDWRFVPPGVLFAHGLKRHSSGSTVAAVDAEAYAGHSPSRIC